MEKQHTKNWRDTAKAVLRGFIEINAYIKEKHISQISNLTLYLKELEKEQTKPRVSRRKEITKVRKEINEVDIRKTRQYQWN